MIGINKNKNERQFLDSEDEFYKLRNEFYQSNGVSEDEAGLEDKGDLQPVNDSRNYEDEIFGIDEADLGRNFSDDSGYQDKEDGGDEDGGEEEKISDLTEDNYARNSYDKNDSWGSGGDEVGNDGGGVFREIYDDEDEYNKNDFESDDTYDKDDLLDDEEVSDSVLFNNHNNWGVDSSANQGEAESIGNKKFGVKELFASDQSYGDEENYTGVVDSGDGVLVGKSKIVLIRQLLENIRDNSSAVLDLLASLGVDNQAIATKIGKIADFKMTDDSEESGKVIEGVFDGQNMIGPDGKQYSVPANYASKSKMVEGDILKLTITDRGTFVYKQIGPIERVRKIGILQKDENGQFLVISEDKIWKVLPASVTYFKGELGNETVVLVPKNSDSKWAAVENIIKNIPR